MTPKTGKTRGEAVIRIPRHSVDWEAVERDYLASVLTLREMAAKAGCSAPAILKHATKHGWVRGGLQRAVRQATEVARMTRDLSSEVNAEVNKAVNASKQGLTDSVAIAVETNLRVMRSHRNHLADHMQDFLKVKAKLLALADGVADLREAATAMSAIESGSRTLKTLIDKERQVFGLDEGDHGGDQSWEQDLAEMHQTMLLERA